MLRDKSLVARLQIQLLHSPVHARGESLVVVNAKADIHDWGAMLKGTDQGSMAAVSIGMCVVEVDVLVP